MLSVQLSFKGMRILIIGGGKQAWRKAQTFLKEEALITMCSITFLEEVPEQLRLTRNYHPEVLDGYALVYACTNDPVLNHTIVQDANELHILSASIHQDEAATLHSMRERHFPYLDVALTTKGASPAYGSTLLSEIEQNYHDHHHERMACLDVLRKQVRKVCDSPEQRSSFLKKLAQEDMTWLTFLRDALKEQNANVFCLHGNSNKDTLTCIHSFLEHFTGAVTAAYLNPAGTIHSIVEVKEALHLLQIPAQYWSITLEEGRISHKIQELLEGEETLQCTITAKELLALFPYDPSSQIVLVLHESKSNTLYQGLKERLPENWKVMNLKDPLPVCDPNNEIILVPVLLLKGKHFLRDILSQEGLYGKLTERYSDVRVIDQCLMENPHYREWLYQKVIQYNKREVLSV